MRDASVELGGIVRQVPLDDLGAQGSECGREIRQHGPHLLGPPSAGQSRVLLRRLVRLTEARYGGSFLGTLEDRVCRVVPAQAAGPTAEDVSAAILANPEIARAAAAALERVGV
ncbi:hypothetical protein ABR738_00950 [Streptomyces sp. Edi4]|uniref:hypothetical protein n=1 Tax=Streptomyces sp. Edi4 TaxID=3162527 RepID=UPI0033065A1E